MSAFGGDPAVKASLLASLDGDIPVPLLERGGAGEPQLTGWAVAVGLAPSLVLLAARLTPATSLTVDPAAVDFAQRLLSRIGVGVETASLAHAWMRWAWDGAPEPLSSSAASPAHLQARVDVAALHQRAADGDSVPRGEWRLVRARLNVLAQADDEPGAVAAVLAAGAWDLNLVPGATRDVVSAWEGLYRARIQRANGWGPADDARLESLLDKIRPILRERIGANPGRDDPKARAAYVEHLQSELTALVREHNDPVWDQFRAQQQTIGDALARLRRQGRDALLRLVGQSSRPDHRLSGGDAGVPLHD